MVFQTKIDKKKSIAVVMLNTRLDALNSQQLQKKFKSLLPQTSQFVFDCTELDFIDSSGLGALVTSLRKAEEAGGGLILAGLGPKAKMVFEVTRAETLFTSYDTVDDAVASFTQ